MMKKNFEYIEIEEGKSQYEEYDLTENKTVDAIYVRAKLEIDQGNKYIEALPFPRRHEDINREYKRILVGYKKDDVKKMTKFDKMMQITAIYDEYSEIQIMNAYKQVKRNDAANGKSEKEITRMVIDRLQKKNNAKQKSKNKPIFTDRTQMENFLKLS